MKGDHNTTANASTESDLLCAEGKPDLQKVWLEIQKEAARVIRDEPRLSRLM